MKDLVELWICIYWGYAGTMTELNDEVDEVERGMHQQNKLGIAALADSTIDCTNYACL